MDKRDLEVLRRIKALETSIRDFKTSQPIGTDSVKTYTSATNNEWDIIWTATLTGGSAWNRWRIKFKADHQDAPFGRIRAVADFNGVPFDFSTRSGIYLNGNFLRVADDYLGNGLSSSTNSAEFEDPQLLRFVAEGSALAAGVVVRIKFFVDATDTGRVYFTGGQNG
jgi:hypothetical protein